MVVFYVYTSHFCPCSTIRLLWGSCSTTAERGLPWVSEVSQPPPPQQKNEASPSASRLLSEWTDPAARGLVIYSVCSVSGGHGARTREGHKRKTERMAHGDLVWETSLERIHEELGSFKSHLCNVLVTARTSGNVFHVPLVSETPTQAHVSLYWHFDLSLKLLK